MHTYIYKLKSRRIRYSQRAVLICSDYIFGCFPLFSNQVNDCYKNTLSFKLKISIYFISDFDLCTKTQ